MSVVTLASIRDNAGRKPFLIGDSITKNANGAYVDTIFTPDQDKTYQITTAHLFFYAGTCNVAWQMGLDDGVNQYLFLRTYNPTINISYIIAPDIIFEYPTVIKVWGTVTANPFTYYYGVMGSIYKRGEGVID